MLNYVPHKRISIIYVAKQLQQINLQCKYNIYHAQSNYNFQCFVNDMDRAISVNKRNLSIFKTISVKDYKAIRDNNE